MTILSGFEKEYETIKQQLLLKENYAILPSVSDFDDFKEMLSRRRLILYGCGVGGYAVGDWLKGLGITVDGFADSKRTGVFPYNKDKIIPLKELIEQYKDANVLISSKNYNIEIYNLLLSNGFPEKQVFHFPKLFPYMPNSKVKTINFDDFTSKYFDGYKWAYNFFADDESKRIVVGKLRAYLLGTPLSVSNNYPMYFDRDIISLGENEIFVDGGAYYGDSIVSIINESKGLYKHIYSFEPTTTKCKIMQQEFNENNRISIIQKGLWSKEAKLHISIDNIGAASSCVINVSNNVEKIDVVGLDSFFADKEFPTFIKMDIEGSELEALRGAAQILSANKPKLAICAYHKIEDIYELPQEIIKNRKDYCFALRQHEEGFCDTVLYAV